MTKSILFVSYSQSGQTKQMIDLMQKSFVQKPDQYKVYNYNIAIENDFPFPWSSEKFFDAFPETYLKIPRKLKPIPEEILANTYDFVILGYQPWYLSPSLPFTSFLMSEQGKNLLKNKNVLTVIGARNMWTCAQEKTKKMLVKCGANLVGNIALFDRTNNYISAITVVQWMFKGTKDKYLGFFPKPGISDKDIQKMSLYGEIIEKAIADNELPDLQNKLLGKKAVELKPVLIFTEQRGNQMFGKWAPFILKKGEAGNPNRNFRAKMFYYYLIFVIWFVSPIVSLIFLMVYLPFKKIIDKKYAYFGSVELKN